MDDLFSSATLFLPAIDPGATPERKALIEELETLLKNSAFLGEGEKLQMKKVIPLFTDPIIKDLKETLIRENLRYLQNKLTTPAHES